MLLAIFFTNFFYKKKRPTDMYALSILIQRKQSTYTSASDAASFGKIKFKAIPKTVAIATPEN